MQGQMQAWQLGKREDTEDTLILIVFASVFVFASLAWTRPKIPDFSLQILNLTIKNLFPNFEIFCPQQIIHFRLIGS